MRKFVLLLALILILCLPALAEESENLLYNGDFSEISASGGPAGWYRDMWYTDPEISSFGTDEEGLEGGCAWVYSAEENDARWAQDLWVRPDTVYRLSGMVKAQSVGDQGVGATLSFKDTFVYTEAVLETEGDWAYVEVYGKTASDQNSLTVFLRVGGYGNLNYGRAWFDNIELVELSEAPLGAKVWDLTPNTVSSSSELLAGETAAPGRSTEAYLLAAFAFVLIAVGAFNKSRRFELSIGENRSKWFSLFVLVLAAGLVLRVVLAAMVRGYSTDIGCFEGWSERIYSVGLKNFYAEDYFCDYPPGYMLLLWPVALLRNALGVGYNSTAHVILIKMIPILFDLVGAMALYRFAEKRLGGRAALLLGGFYLFNPAVFVDSAAWGQIDSVFTLLIALCAIEACKRRYHFSLPLFALAVLIKPQALLFAPLGLMAVAVGVAFVSPSELGEQTGASRLEERSRRLSLLLQALGGLGLALIVMYLVALPFSSGRGIFAPVEFLWDLYGKSMQGYKNITINTLNLYQIFGKNWVDMARVPGLTLLSWCLFVFSYLYSLFLLGFSRDRHKVFLTGGLLIVLIFAFAPMMHERYVFPAILLLALAYAECRDKRVMYSLICLSATLFMNEVLVLQGGLDGDTIAQYGHLQSNEQWLNVSLSVINVLNALWLSYVAWDIAVKKRVWANRPARLAEQPAPDYRLRLKRKDYLLVAAVTAAYSILAFANLGSASAPETSWTSSAPGEQAVFDLGQERAFRMTYYGGISNTAFTVRISSDGENWSDAYTAKYDQGQIFRWLWFSPSESDRVQAFEDLNDWGGSPDFSESASRMNVSSLAESNPLQTARYIQIEANAENLILSEIGFLDENGEPYPIASVTGDGDVERLADEQETVPPYPSYYNSTYFDEIYHARTAYEHLHGLETYEWTHPPLGKVLMMLGIELFGMTPFGWRFMGTIMGVLMLPMMYLLVKQLTKKSNLAFIAMFLLAVDSMHFTQTRIATIDSYAVFFIMVMYFFMFRFCQMRWKRDGFARSLIPLGLSGLFMGVAWATKWIGIYGSVGLVALFFWAIWQNLRDFRSEGRLLTGHIASFALTWAGLIGLMGALGGFVMGEAGYLNGQVSGLLKLLQVFYQHRVTMTVLGFVLAGGGIALLCLFDHERFWKRLALTSAFCVMMFILVPLAIYYFSYYWHMQYQGGLSLKNVVGLQKRIFDYHAGLGGDTHLFRSDWYEWPIIWWPMWFFSGSEYLAEGMVSSISCMGNPAVWWFGLVAILFVMVNLCRSGRAKRANWMVVIAFASQFLPWVLVPRSTFIYHYFASVPFIIAASALMLDAIREKSEAAYRVTAGTLLALALLLFVAFYPLESGAPVARSYANLLRWFQWINF